LNKLRHALPPDTAVIAAVDRLTCSDVMPLVKQIAHESRISSRQLQRRFRTAVGMTPKRFVRVVRFARVWQLTGCSCAFGVTHVGHYPFEDSTGSALSLSRWRLATIASYHEQENDHCFFVVTEVSPLSEGFWGGLQARITS